MKATVLLVLLFFSPGAVSSAFADSDGYYCIGQGYLAYQFGMAPLPVAPHRLYVIRFDGAHGIPEPVALDLPQFQVHGLRCGAGWVDVAAYSAIYRVTLDDAVRPVRYDVRQLPDGLHVPPEFLPQLNLGALNRANADLQAHRIVLSTKPTGGGYFLVMTGDALPPERCRTALRTRVVETDRNGRVIGARTIFEGEGRRECGGGSGDPVIR